MTTEAVDPIELLARLNPVSPECLDELAHGEERETTLARIRACRSPQPAQKRRVPKRRLAAAAVVAVALAIPALAFSGVLGSLFGLSNQGTPVAQSDLSSVTALRFNGVDPRSLVELRAADGVAIYDAKTASGDICFYVGPSDATDVNSSGLSGGCLNSAASAEFPSPSRPVWDMSLFALAPGAAGPSVQRLAGVAADGVASVQLLALADCNVVATAPVIDNVYVADNLPLVPEATIVARDAGGNAVWHEAVTPEQSPHANSCGLG